MNNPKERPIIFNSQEVNAVLAGDKTQHRVPVSPQDQVANGRRWTYGVPSEQFIFCRKEGGDVTDGNYITIDHPFMAVGDRLWVKEPFIPDPPSDHDAWEDDDSVTSYFQWDGCGSKLSEIPKRLRTPDHVIYKASWHDPDSMIWVSASQMRKWTSRLLLEITNIRIERVHDITHNDSVAEYCFNFGEKKKQCIPPLSGFAEYWREKHGDDSWRSNPWVWVIEFKVIEPSEVQSG